LKCPGAARDVKVCPLLPTPGVLARSVALALTALALPAAQAQPAASTTPTPAVTAAPAISVTATRVERSPQDVPASLDVIDGRTLGQDNAKINLSESLNRVPGLVVNNRQNYAQDLQISSRGFGARSTFGVRGIRLIADGIPATMPDGQGQISHLALVSADRVEVLRGPMSALYGNSSGGVIQLISADAPQNPQIGAGLTAGSFGTRKAELQLGGTAGTVSGTAEWSHFATDGYRERSAATRTLANAKMQWKLSASTSIALVGNAVSMPDVQDPLGLSRAEYEANPRQATALASQFNTRKTTRQSQGGVTLDHALDDNHSLRIVGYAGARSIEQYQAIPVATQAPITHPGGVIDLSRRYAGLDARYTYKGLMAGQPVTLTTGLNLDRLDEARKGYANFTGVGATQRLGVLGVLKRDEDNRVTNTDFYAQGEWTPLAPLSLSAGLRASVVRFRSMDKFIVPGNGDDSGTATYRALTPVAGALWRVSQATNLYLTAGRGFETPTFNELAYRAEFWSAASQKPTVGNRLQIVCTAEFTGDGSLV
jgi:iron complex outermembrane recepter protein